MKYFSVCFICCLLIIGYSNSAQSASNDYKMILKIVLSLGLGENQSEVGGLTEEEVNKKEDPLAFFDANPQDFLIDPSGIIIADTYKWMLKKYNYNGKIIWQKEKCGESNIDFPSKIERGEGNILITANATGSIINIITNDNKCINVNPSNQNFYGDLFDITTNKNGFTLNNDSGKSLSYSYTGEPIGVVHDTSDADHSKLVKYINEKAKLNGYIVNSFINNEPVNSKYFFVGLKKNIGLKKNEWNLVIISDNDNNVRVYPTFIEGYDLTKFRFSNDGRLYAMGINALSRNDFLRIFEIIIPELQN